MKYCLCILILVLVVVRSSIIIAQDVQFSQFYANPLYLNPALTGAHAGTYRVMTNYRDQWRGSIEQPFTTFSASGDLKFTIPNAGGAYSKDNDFAAVGMMFYSDRVANIDYNTNNLSLFGAYHKLLSSENRQYLSVGLQLGIAQRGINYEDLTFGDQWNGATGYTEATQETLPANSLAYNDLGIGLHYSMTKKSGQSLYLGASIQHWNRPNISFYNNDPLYVNISETDRLDSKFSLHGGASIPLNNATSFQPRGIYLKQGQFSTFVVGSNIKYRIIDSDGVALHLGAWLRGSDNLTTFQPTDIILSAGYEMNGMLIGFSYDAHLRKLSGSTLGQGMFELSIAYTGEHDNETRICPEF